MSNMTTEAPNTNECPICSHQEAELWYAGGSIRQNWRSPAVWQVWRCTYCDHRHVYPLPDESELWSYYSKGYSAYDFAHGLADSLASTINDARSKGSYRHVDVKPGMRILDVGCGGGSFLHVCRELGAQVQGVEPSQDGVESCRIMGIPVFPGDLTQFLLRSSEKFDLITANHVVEHHPDPKKLVKEMRSLLRPSGSLWISVPNAGCVFSRHLKSSWHSSDLPVHLQHFTHKSIEKLFEASEMRITQIRTESENSLDGSLAILLRKNFMVPSRVTRMVFGNALRKDGWLGKRIDHAGNGEALLVWSQKA